MMPRNSAYAKAMARMEQLKELGVEITLSEKTGSYMGWKWEREIFFTLPTGERFTGHILFAGSKRGVAQEAVRLYAGVDGTANVMFLSFWENGNTPSGIHNWDRFGAVLLGSRRVDDHSLER